LQTSEKKEPKFDEKEVSQCIKRSIEQQKKLNDQWSDYASFVYEKTLSRNDIQVLNANNRDTFDFNIVFPYIWQSLKNVKESSITANFSQNEGFEQQNMQQMGGLTTDQVVKILNTKYQSIQSYSNYNDVIYQASTDAYIGGKGVVKIRTEYENDYDFRQRFVIEHVLNPTRVYFDNKARHSTKKDGDYVFEIIQMSKNDFKKRYPDIDVNALQSNEYGQGINIMAEDGNKDKKLINIVEYYYKNKTYKTIYLTESGQVVENKAQTNEEITQERRIEECKIMMARMVGDVVLEGPNKTEFTCLPYVMVMGQRYYDKNDKEHISPFAKHAFDAQRVKNMMMNYFMYEAVNNRTATIALPEECETEKTMDAIRNPSTKQVLIYKALHRTAEGQMAALKPEPLNAGTLPTQYLEVFNSLDQTIQATLGANFPSMNTMNMSGKALYNISQFMSASNSQFMQHLQCAAIQIGIVIMESMPAVLSEETFELEVMQEGKEVAQEQKVKFDFMFEKAMVNVDLLAGVSNTLQKEHTIETLMTYGETSETVKQFLNDPQTVLIMLKNLDLNNKHEIIEAFESYAQKIQQSSSQPNPEQQMEAQALQIKGQDSQAKLLNAENQSKKISLEAMKTGIQHQIDEQRLELDAHKVHSSNQAKLIDNVTKLAHTNMEFRKTLLQHLQHLHGVKQNGSEIPYS